MRPDVVLVWRHVEIADKDMAVAVARMQRCAGFHFVEKLQFMCELRIERGIGNVAARRYIEIMQRERRSEPGHAAQRHTDVA